MSKFKFDMSVVVEARSVEAALSAVSAHIANVNRQMASDVQDLAPEFTVKQVDDKTEAVDLTDKASQSKTPIELNLDPKSPAGIARKAQVEREESERQARQRARVNEGRSDAEILAEHSAREQETLNAKT